VQPAVEAQAIGIQRIRGQLTGNLPELVFHGLGNAHIKDVLHQRFDREEMGVDVLEVADGLLQSLLRRGFLGSSTSGGGSRRLGARLRGGFL